VEAIDYFFIVMGSLGVILIGLGLLKQAVPLHWRRLTLPTATWYAYIILLVIPSVEIFVVEAPPQASLTLGLILSSALTIPIGVLGAAALWRSSPKEIQNFYAAEMEPVSHWQRNRLLILTTLALLFSVLFFFETGIPPFIQALVHPGEYNLLTGLRQQVTTDLQSAFSLIYFMLRQFGWAFVLSCWLGIAWTKPWPLKRWLIFSLLFAFGLFYCSATLVRSPAVVMFIVIFFFYYLFRSGQIPLSRIFLMLTLAFVMPILVLFLHDPLRSWESIFIGIAQRVFYAPAKLNFQYIKLFPQEIDFLYGRGIGKLSQVVGLLNPRYEYFPISQEVYQRLFPDSPYRGSAPAPFVGMAYANWGWIGPPLYGLGIGFLLESIQIWLIRQRKTLFLLAAHAVLFYSFFEINRTDFFATLFSYGGLIVPLFLILLQAKWDRKRYASRGVLLWEKLFSEGV